MQNLYVDTSPYVGFGTRPGDPSWTAVMSILVSEMYHMYGDVQIIETYYDALHQYTDYLWGRYQSSGASNMFGNYGSFQ